jgi:succinoglycan biosynthesis protein ExoA
VSLLVVIPCLNEAAHLPALLAALRGDPGAATARIVVADGGSTDASVSIVNETAQADARVVLLHNSARIQSAGVNQAVRAHGADAEFLVRVDAHAAYPANYLSKLSAAQRESGADAVTVSMRAAARGGGCFERATACAQNSVLGAGGSPHRKKGPRRWVDHGHHALMSIRAFNDAGGYDEGFTHNEDAELDARLARQGARILLAADIVIDYFPRASAATLARQYLKYGEGRARTLLKHHVPLKWRQLVAAAIAPVATLGLALAPLAPVAAAPALLWLAATLGYGLYLGVREKDACACAAGAAAMIMHFAWSVGFLSALIAANRPKAANRPQARRTF